MDEEKYQSAWRGRVSDTSNNWLPGAKITLLEAGISATTDGNGLFEMPVAHLPEPVSADAAWVTLRLEKEGHMTRNIKIKDRSFFSEFSELLIEPTGVSDDAEHIEYLLPGENTRRFLGAGIHPDDDPAQTSVLLGERMKELVKEVNRPEGKADFYGWIPPGDEPLRCVFFTSLHGMGCIDHPILRQFAERQRVALVGLMGGPVQTGICPTELLDSPLTQLAEKMGHPEIVNLPVLLFGHSNGTCHATTYASSRPERVIAWVSYHSGFGWQLLLPNLEQSPGLIMHGQLDNWFENGQEAAFLHLRAARNAPVTMMVEGNVGHGPVDTGATWEFIVAFYEACLRLRLDDAGKLRNPHSPANWFGAPYDRSFGGQQLLAIAPEGTARFDRATASWLPDEHFAAVWQSYGLTDPRLKIGRT